LRHCGLALVAGALLTAPAAGAATAKPHVVFRPSVIVLGGRAVVEVTGWRGVRLQVSLAGATDATGRALGWRSARRSHGKWLAELPRPAFRGIYPLRLRVRARGTVVGSERWLLRVFRRAAAREPSFASPAAAVRWWVRGRGALAALRRWPRPRFDRRDPRLHRLFVVAYNLPRRPGIRNRVGRFVTVVRDGYHGRWRLLEATVAP
jgi:hypothetical protein